MREYVRTGAKRISNAHKRFTAKMVLEKPRPRSQSQHQIFNEEVWDAHELYKTPCMAITALTVLLPRQAMRASSIVRTRMKARKPVCMNWNAADLRFPLRPSRMSRRKVIKSSKTYKLSAVCWMQTVVRYVQLLVKSQNWDLSLLCKESDSSQPCGRFKAMNTSILSFATSWKGILGSNDSM